ncbi:hypothetical protein [Sphingorhabdus sp.]|uniref:hypothetical protein n=1 Tax=Sphingorhabdus sp. TaxID=1902408 RepID=UPI0039194365
MSAAPSLLLGNVDKDVRNVAEICCISDELIGLRRQKKGAAEATPFLSILLQDILIGWCQPE